MSNFRDAVVLAVGDELVLGQTVDTNSAWLSARLAERGVHTRYHKTVADDRAAIAAALSEAVVSPLVLVTGGLGPTEDDLTRQAMADALGVPLEEDPKAVRRIEAFFRSVGKSMPDRNRIQAHCPRGAELLENDRGTAPGLRAVLSGSTFVVMPGVPHEMRGMFERFVVPMLTGGAGAAICSEVVRTFGLGESEVGTRLNELMARDRNPLVGTTVSNGIVSVRIRGVAATPDEAARLAAEGTKNVRERLGEAVFGTGETTLAEAVVSLLRSRRLTVATAESCTGGLIGKLLTDVPGASDVYLGGWVVYSNALKRDSLGVPDDALTRHGAVSREVAEMMSARAAEMAGADYALAVTGIAGPAGGSAGKPVGTVWLALARRNEGRAEVTALHRRFPGAREHVRERTALTALDMLRLELLGRSGHR
jgi:nicotinamide-nucleotide amidase